MECGNFHWCVIGDDFFSRINCCVIFICYRCLKLNILTVVLFFALFAALCVLPFLFIHLIYWCVLSHKKLFYYLFFTLFWFFHLIFCWLNLRTVDVDLESSIWIITWKSTSSPRIFVIVLSSSCIQFFVSLMITFSMQIVYFVGDFFLLHLSLCFSVFFLCCMEMILFSFNSTTSLILYRQIHLQMREIFSIVIAWCM